MGIRWNLPGRVYLAGAGPGSAKLLTVRAAEVLQRADVVFHDDLVSEDVLGTIPSRTAVFNVGKRCGSKKVTQEEIHRRMISAAREGRNVVRLKGGDPLIFARIQEEIDALREAGIEFEIVPGVTAATAAAAGAEMPLTERSTASKLIFASNHRCAGNGARLWGEGALSDATLVIYMPGRNLATLKEDLCASGLCGGTPCLLVSQASGAKQRLVRTQLRDLGQFDALPAPSLVIVGDVVLGARAAEEVTRADALEVIFAGEQDKVAAREPDDIAVND